MAKDVFATTPKVTVTQNLIKGAPAPQMVRIYHKKDKTFQDVFAVDAKEIVAQGEYDYDPDAGPSTPENVYKPEPPVASAALPDFDAMTKAELQDYAAAHDVEVTASMSKAEQIEAIKGGD